MVNKQTAVDWFVTELLSEVSKSDTMAIAKFWEIVEQAKQMEKEQIINAYKAECETLGFDNEFAFDAEHYYNETYEGKDN